MPAEKLTACVGCRGVKAKCVFEDSDRCTRCIRRDETCDRPVARKTGRPKGSLNRRSGADDVGGSPEMQRSETESAPRDDPIPSEIQPPVVPPVDGGLSNPVLMLAEAAVEGSPQPETGIPPEYHLPGALRAMLFEGGVEDQLQVSSEYLAQGLEAMLSETARKTLDNDDMRFFKPLRKQVRRDLGPEYDPLSLALLEPKEITAFFSSFFRQLHPMLPVLDPALHTPDCRLTRTLLIVVRSRSAFLFTAICAHGASLTPGASEATKRLRIHTQRLSDMVSRKRFASVEIVQAFLIWTSWLPSSESFQEERLWHATKYAINMAVELGLGSDDVIPVEQDTSVQLDGTSAERIVRNKERLWIHLFLWDANLSLAFGKATRFAQNDLIKDNTWCFHALATKNDTVTVACVDLRRQLVGQTDAIRSEIYSRRHSTEWVAEMIDGPLQSWHSTWSPLCQGSPYLELLYRHTRLWILSYGLSLSNTSSEALTGHCFQAALDSCEFVCEQLRAKELWGLPNTMGPMLAFEALLAVRLFPRIATSSRKARLLGLLAQLSLLLEEVGSTPPHRLGTAAVYGRHLQVYIRRRVISLCLSHHRNGALASQTEISPNSQIEATINEFFTIDQFMPTLHPGDDNFFDASNVFDMTWGDDFVLFPS